MKKKTLIGIFSLTTLIPLLLFLSLGFFCLTKLVDIFPEANQEEVEIAARRTLDLYGFKGDMKVTKFSRDLLVTNNYTIEFDYTEEFDGRPVTVSDSMLYHPRSSKSNPKKTREELAYDKTTKTMLQEFSSMAHKLLNQHPVSVANKEKVESFFKQYTNPNMEYVNSFWSVDTEAENIQEYFSLVETNRKEGKAFQGLYDLSIPIFLEKEIIKGYVIYRDIILEEGGADRFGGKDGLKEFITKGVDEADLPDALYDISYYYGGKTGKSYRSGDHLPLKIQHQKMLYFGSKSDE